MNMKRVNHTPDFSRRIVLWIFIATVAWVDGEMFAQAGGTIRGTVQLRDQVQIVPRARVSRYRTSVPQPAEAAAVTSGPEVTNVVLYLEGKGLGDVRRAALPAVLDQRNAAFIPHVLPVVKGTSVRIVNRDKTYHNVFSLSSAKKFNIGRRPTGKEVPVEFDKSGVVQVFCDIHSNMSAFVLVLDNPMFVQPNESGEFELTNIPPGQYTLHAWHERLTAAPEQVTIRSGETVTVNFDLQ